MAIVYTGPAVPGGEVSPGSGTTGFTSNAVAFANSSGQLTGSTNLTLLDHATSAQFRIGSTQTPTTNNMTGMLVVGFSSSPTLGFGTDRIQARSSASASNVLQLNPGGGQVNFGAGIQVGTSNASGKLNLPSTVNISTAVGTSGAAAAPPANPEVYVRVVMPNAAHTLTTLYIPCYLSTG